MGTETPVVDEVAPWHRGTVAVPVNMAPKWDSSGEAGHFKTIRSDYT